MPYLNIVFHNIQKGGINSIGQPTSRRYYTRYDVHEAGTACLDYALIPNHLVAYVELWAHCAAAAATLSGNYSDQAVMLLRIRST